MYTTRLIRIRGFIQCPTPYFLFFSQLILHPDQWRRKKIPVILSFLRWGFFFPGGNYCNFFFNKKKPRWFFPRILRTNAQEIWTLYSFLGIYRRRYMCIISFVSRVLLNVWKQPPRKIQGKNTSLSYRNKVTVPFLALSVKIYM